MSAIKDLLDKVKAKFETPVLPVQPVAPLAPVLPVIPAAPAQLMSTTYKTMDGVELMVEQMGDEPAAGDKVTIAGAPAPAADYKIDDGSTVTVGEGGLVVSYTEVAAADPVMPPAPGQPAAPDMSTALEARVAALEAELTKMRQPLTQMESVQLSMSKVDKQEETIKGIFEMLEMMVKGPTANPKTLPENQKVNEKEKNLEKFTTAMRNFKKESKEAIK